jgi:hypothetical protein
MRGRVLSLLLLLFSFASSAFPSCGWSPRHSSPFRATAFDVVIDGEGYVWAATGYGVQLYSPAGDLVSTIAIPNLTRVLERNGALVYAGSGDRVFVLRRIGETLQLATSVNAGGTVNDLLIAGSYLFAATSSGIRHFDIFDPALPIATNVSLATSNPAVHSLALNGSLLYAADGDSTVEVISLSLPALPQNTGTIDSFFRSAAVHTNRGFLFVSDDLGQNTDILLPNSSGSGASRFARVGYGTNAFLPLTGDLYFVAGTDRSVRAIDVTNAQRPAELFEQQLSPTGGTNNRIYSLARSGNTIYAAAGDMGLIAFDVRDLVTAPHPLTSYADGATTSALVAGNDAFFTDAGGNIIQQTIDRNGIALTPVRTWSAGAGSVLHDHNTTALLTSSGAAVKIWTIATQTEARAVTFPSAVKSAVLLNNVIVAVLANGSLWTAADTTPSQGNGTFDLIARSGNAVALADVTDDGKTNILYFANGDLSAPVRTVTVNGAATGGLALNAQYAVVFTFAGLNVIDLANGNVRVLPESHRTIPRALRLVADDLVVLGDRTLTLWSAGTGEKRAEHSLPASAVTLGIGPAVAAIATTEGKIIAEYGRALPAPQQRAGENRYYTKVVAGGDRVYLFDEVRVDIFSASSGIAPHYLSTVDASGSIDIAASSDGFFTLGANGVVTAYSKAGGAIAQAPVTGMVDAQPLRIFTAGNAVWASFSTGCGSGICQETTAVLDPRSLAVTATMNGSVRDVFVSGTRAYALFEFPDEIRVLDITNGSLPSLVASANAPALSRSITFGGDRVHVLANRIHSYTTALAPIGQALDSISAPNGMVRAQDGCAVVIGRRTRPEFFTVPDWGTTLELIESPATPRSVALLTGRAYILTDYSLEVWMNANPAPPAKRRGVR